MKRGRPLAELSLTTRQREELIGWTRRSTMSQALALRARIILACARTTSNAEVAEALRVSRHTVGKWRKRFSTQGVDGLFDGPRPGTPRQIGDDQVEAVVAKTLQTKPTDATQWRSEAHTSEHQ